MADEPDLTSVDTDDDDTSTADGDTTAAADDTTADGDTTLAADDKATGDDAGSDDAGDGADDKTPETYAEFKMPEGVELDGATLEAALPLFKEMSLTQEQAQKLVDFQAAQMQTGQAAQVEAFEQLKKDWLEEATNDKEFGGDKFEESVGLARDAIDKLGTPELKKLLEDHGVGNHPEMIRLMSRIGGLMKEDNPGGNGRLAGDKLDHAEILYPKSETA